jgi:hypothetical protein
MTSEDSDTTSPLVRYEHTNDVVGTFYLFVFVLFVGLDAYTALFSLGAVPRSVRAVWLAIAGIVAAWMFGEAAVRAWRGS